jgi:hypothetical protein
MIICLHLMPTQSRGHGTHCALAFEFRWLRNVRQVAGSQRDVSPRGAKEHCQGVAQAEIQNCDDCDVQNHVLNRFA